MKEYTSHSIEETEKIAEELSATFSGGDIVLLYGNLGAGKTALTKAIGKALGVTEEVTSPTFAIMNVYPVEANMQSIGDLVHIDTYRLDHEEDLVDIGAEDYIANPQTLTIIEWPEKIRGLLRNQKTKKIYLEHVDENTRNIKISG